MSNILRVARNVDFHQLMRVSHAILHSHDTMIVQARGKQIQRAVELMCVLQVQKKSTIGNIRFDSIVLDNGSPIPTLEVCMNSLLRHL